MASISALVRAKRPAHTLPLRRCSSESTAFCAIGIFRSGATVGLPWAHMKGNFVRDRRFTTSRIVVSQR